MQSRKIASLVLSLTTAMAALQGAGAPAQASVLQGAASASGNSVGLIVTYRQGVDPIAQDGQPTGENFAGVDLTHSHDIGLNMTDIRFAKNLSDNDAAAALARIQNDPRVLTAELDRHVSLKAAGYTPRNLIAEPVSLIKVATPVRSVKASNLFNSATPRVTKVQLSWTAPTSLNGGKLTGYRIETSADNKNWTIAVAKTSLRTATLTSGFSIGQLAYYRVRALTKVGLAAGVGAPSVSAIVTPAVAPTAPLFSGPNVIFSGQSATWNNQSLAERGGLPVSYTVTAVAQSGSTVSCTTISNSCTPSGLAPNTGYTFSVQAANALGNATSLQVNDPMYATQWHLYSNFGIQSQVAWQVTKGKPSIVVAVLDSGITSHPDLNGQTLPGFDFISKASSAHDGQALSAATGDWDADPTDVGDYDPTVNGSTSSWHGTHVAGLIAAAQNSVGVSGVAPGVKILPVRVLGSAGGDTSDLIAAINWAAGLPIAGVPTNANPARVMNLSIGTEIWSSCDFATQSAFRAAWDNGVTAVTAAGNGDASGHAMEAINSYPGNCVPTINVGATGYSGDASYFSNFGQGVDFSAPGGDDHDAPTPYTSGTDGMILSTWNNGATTTGSPDYSIEEGTSMASPIVAGIVALIYSVNPKFTSEDAYNIIKKSVRPFKAGTQCANTASQYGLAKTDPAYTDGYSYCGLGIVDAGAAVKLAQNTTPTVK